MLVLPLVDPVFDHGEAHEEAVQVDGGGGDGDLRQLEHDAGLPDEVDAFGAVLALLAW